MLAIPRYVITAEAIQKSATIAKKIVTDACKFIFPERGLNEHAILSCEMIVEWPPKPPRAESVNKAL